MLHLEILLPFYQILDSGGNAYQRQNSYFAAAEITQKMLQRLSKPCLIFEVSLSTCLESKTVLTLTKVFAKTSAITQSNFA